MGLQVLLSLFWTAREMRWCMVMTVWQDGLLCLRGPGQTAQWWLIYSVSLCMFQFDTIKSVGGSQCPDWDHIDLPLTGAQYIVYGRASHNCNEQPYWLIGIPDRVRCCQHGAPALLHSSSHPRSHNFPLMSSYFYLLPSDLAHLGLDGRLAPMKGFLTGLMLC